MRWCEVGLVAVNYFVRASGLGFSGDLAPFIAHPPILISQVTQAQQSTNKHNTTDSLTHHEIGAILNET